MPGGQLVFHTTSVLAAICPPQPSRSARRELLRPQREAYRLVTHEGRVEFHPSHGDRIKIMRASGFTVHDLRELYAPPDAPTIPTTNWQPAE